MVNRALADGLSDKYDFIPGRTNRKFGGTRQSSLNPWNLYYFVKHWSVWLLKVVIYRPKIAHYSINSGWALWKALAFLRIARLCGARTIGHLHSGSFITFWKSLDDSRRKRAAAELAKLDAFVVLSEGWRVLAETELKIAPRKLFVVNNPIDGVFEETALGYEISDSRVSILAIGILGTDKGVLDLLDACGQLRETHSGFELVIAGPEREPGITAKVFDRIAAHKLQSNVILAGPVHGDAKLKLFRESGILALPSHYENFPLVVLEAAAAGMALVSTPVGAVPEFFEDGVSAIFVRPTDASALASALRSLISDPSRRLRLSSGARKAFKEKLSRIMIMHSMEAVYEEVLEREKNRKVRAA